jgi:hypothetical protein
LLLAAAPWIEGGQFVGIGVIYVSNVLLLNIRFPVERGSDGMMNVVFGALFLRQFASDIPIVTEACLWFIALQVSLSYGSCGVAALQSWPCQHGGRDMPFSSWRIINSLVHTPWRVSYTRDTARCKCCKYFQAAIPGVP